MCQCICVDAVTVRRNIDAVIFRKWESVCLQYNLVKKIVMQLYLEINYVIPTQIYANIQTVRYRNVRYTYNFILWLIKSCRQYQWTSQKMLLVFESWPEISYVIHLKHNAYHHLWMVFSIYLGLQNKLFCLVHSSLSLKSL